MLTIFIEQLLAFTLLLTHEDYDEAQKLINVARENDKDFRAIDNIWNNWIKYALRCKQFTTNRVHVLHIAGIIQQHCYKRFDLAERFFEMALLRSDKNLNQDIMKICKIFMKIFIIISNIIKTF